MKESVIDIDVVCDLDHTLFRHSFLTKIFFTISSIFHRLALKNVDMDHSIFNAIHGKRVLILTGRDKDHDRKIIEKKLKKYDVKYTELMMCPRNELFLDWKLRELNKLKEHNPNLVWYDDEKPKGY